MAWLGAEKIAQDVKGYIEDNCDAKIAAIEAAAQSAYGDSLALDTFAEVRLGQPDRKAIQTWPIAYVMVERSRIRGPLTAQVHDATYTVRVGVFVREQDTATLESKMSRYTLALMELLTDSIDSLGYHWNTGDGAQFDQDYGAVFVKDSRYSSDAFVMTTCRFRETRS